MTVCTAATAFSGLDAGGKLGMSGVALIVASTMVELRKLGSRRNRDLGGSRGMIAENVSQEPSAFGEKTTLKPPLKVGPKNSSTLLEPHSRQVNSMTMRS